MFNRKIVDEALMPTINSSSASAATGQPGRNSSSAASTNFTCDPCSPENPKWKSFLYDFYTEERKKNPSLSLQSIYPIAKKRFLSVSHTCDISLNLIANKRKHRREKKPH